MSEVAQFEDPMEEDEALGTKPMLSWWEDVQNKDYTPKDKKKKEKVDPDFEILEDAREVINKQKATREGKKEKPKWHKELLPDGRIVYRL